MVTTHVTEVATYFHYCRKVTLCLNGKSPNYNFTAPTKQSAATLMNHHRQINYNVRHFVKKLTLDICTLGSKIQRILISTGDKIYSQNIQVVFEDQV